MTTMRVIHRGPEHRPHVEPVFVEEVDVTIREGGYGDAAEPGASATNGVGAAIAARVDVSN
jgi:hypothetical protein